MSYGYNNRYLTKDGAPYFPVMGEMHYSRFPKEYWTEELLKMKAGGVDIVSTYVIWIHHEEIENEFDFTGNRDLRAFISACGACGLKMFLRLGPWCHGEVRNGGFPDWLLKKDYVPRTNDNRYFDRVRLLYEKYFEQAIGYLYKDGGPVIGIQIENEYGHCGGLRGEEGEKHMAMLCTIAKEIGFDVPYYTATGWGGAVTGGMLPVMGGYCDAPWDQRVTEIEPSGNYIFTHEWNDHNIGSDLAIGSGLTFDTSKYPFLTAELGGGLQVTHHRRPIASADDIGAMTLTKLGSGVNLLGYYMYHGGTNPDGKLTTLQESRATGYNNDLPVFSYDFRAPVREFGQMSETLRELKLYAQFVKDFGSELCKTEALIPEDNPLKPEDLSSLRYSYRHNTEETSGYLFINNYQRRREMSGHSHVSLPVPEGLGAISLASDVKNKFREVDIENGDYFFFPYNLRLGNTVLKTALASPFCKLNLEVRDETSAVVFYTDRAAQMEFTDEPDFKVILLSRSDAKNAWKITLDKDYLFISENGFISEGDITMICRSNTAFKTFPRLGTVPEGYEETSCADGFYKYEKIAGIENKVKASMLTEEIENGSLRCDIQIECVKADDVFVTVDYKGDKARLYIDGKQVGDHFYTGEPWGIGLKRFGFPKQISIEIDPLYVDSKVYLEIWPEFKDGKACEVVSVTAEAETYEMVAGK